MRPGRNPHEPEKLRLDRLLARNLGLSRAIIVRLLRHGRVRDPSGSVLKDGGLMIADARPRPRIQIDRDEPIDLYFDHHRLQHKPVGVVTALHDNVHPTARRLLTGVPLEDELRPIGRLDLDCSGLLLWTSAGAWVQWLGHPRRAVEREYHVGLVREHEPWTASLRLADGHEPAVRSVDVLARSEVHPALVVSDECTHFARIVLTAGSYHEVKRVFAALGSRVSSLARVRFGPLELPRDLAPGESLEVDLDATFLPTGASDNGGAPDDLSDAS